MEIELQSFGFRYGPPDLADLVLDVRFLPNPNFEPDLRAGTGRDPEVADYVVQHERSREFLDRFFDFLDFLVPFYEQEGKAYLTIAIGCTGGRHRSVAVAEALAADLRGRGREVNVEHRDMERSE